MDFRTDADPSVKRFACEAVSFGSSLVNVR